MSKKSKAKPSMCCDRGHPVVGDKVAIIREEHGWHDGRLAGTVTHVSCAGTGRVSYSVETTEGYTVFCPKTRDCYKITSFN